jgi:energy-coupling factor transporter ATP-binding protein EcfA2
VTYLAFRNLFQQRFRLALSVGGVALAITLIVLLNGFLQGIYAQVTAYLDNTPADLIVAQDGVTNLLSATSLLPANTEDLARGVPGIARTTPIIAQFVILDIHDEKVVAYLVGYDPELGGGPWEMLSGRPPTDNDEVVLDWMMAQHQDFNLLSALSVLDNVALVGQLSGLSRHAARGRARELLEELGLEHRLSFLPEKLSGGEKQRVAIARALVNAPDIILADEPTANLDSHHGYEIMRLLRRIAKQETRSVIIVSHDRRIRDIADRVLWLEDGQFKNMRAMAIDPVCGMSVDQESAPAQAAHNGQIFYFCARGCRDEFLDSPERFLTEPAEARSMPTDGTARPIHSPEH